MPLTFCESLQRAVALKADRAWLSVDDGWVSQVHIGDVES